MAKEIKIENLDKRKIKKRDAEQDANRLLYDKKPTLGGFDDLSRHLFDNAPMVYLNPTEDLRMREIIVPDAPCAMVLGSGDFAIDAVYHGAKDIVTFDINKYQLYPASLKLKALQNMSYDEYWNFFSSPTSSKYLSLELYEILKKKADSDLSLFAFYDVIMAKRGEELKSLKKHMNKFPRLQNLLKEREMIESTGNSIPNAYSETKFDSMLSSSDHTYSPSKVIRAHQGMAGTKSAHSYLESQESFDTTKEMVKAANIKFIRSDIAKLKNSLDRVGYSNTSSFNGFQTIYLSNVPEYINGREFAMIVDSQLMPLLQDDGAIVYCCQGVSARTLSALQSQLDEMKKAVRDRSKLLGQIYGWNPFAAYQQINDIEAFNLLNSKYRLDLVENEKLCFGNGFDNSDTMVYVKRR